MWRYAITIFVRCRESWPASAFPRWGAWKAALDIPALTDADREALPFVSEHADGIEFSFVQSADDVRQLQEALGELRPDNWREKILVLKIETAQGVVNLPDILVQAAGRQPTAIMIARGDLSVEIGFARTAEVQEELL